MKKRINSLWIVRIIWSDACMHFSKDLETVEPGETQLSIGILLPKVYINRYGKKFFRLVQNYGERQDDGTDIPKSWVIEIEKIAKIPFEYIKIEELMKVKFNRGHKRLYNKTS